ncbi:MAG: alcohol dehydrogenase catalytic domain-containing protein [Erysipelotrichaceae bacterium]|nr:alcohol dehydrogenase catalytic domain-containing protein [Erysipelotrichaceae bacterium]
MKAAVLDTEGRLSVQEVDMPAVPEYGALVRIEYGSTCAGTDARLMRKEHPNPVFYPSVLGHESTGVVVEVNDKVRNYKVGDRISRVGTVPNDKLGVCWGGFAQYGIALDWMAMKEDGVDKSLWAKNRVNKVIPEDIDPKDCPMIITWRETLSYFNRLNVPKGANVLITGSGANSLAFVNHAIYNEDRVVVIGSPSRNPDALKAGAVGAIDYHEENIQGSLKEYFPEGIDFIIDGVGNSTNVNKALALLNEGATVGVYGWNDRKGYGINPFMTLKNFRVYCAGYDEPETHDEVIKRIREGKLHAQDFYDKDDPIALDDIAEAYERLRNREAYKFLIDMK